MRISHCLLAVLLVAGHAAAWDCPGGVKGTDQVTGSTVFYGIKQDKPLKYMDMTQAWKKFGPLTKINLYYSYNYGCLQGAKMTYGYDARNAQMLGIQKNLAEVDLALAPYEGVTKVELREAAGSKCIEWIKLTSSKGKSVVIGNGKSGQPIQTATATKGGFLATVRGYEDYMKGQAVTKGGLQQLQFVWGVAVCPAATKPKPAPVPKPVPAAPVPEPVPVPEPTPAPVEEAEPASGEPEAPKAEPTMEGLCPPMPDMCDEAATSGDAFCPAVSPFTYNQCAGGCCISSGKCKKARCGASGLGSEVFAVDTLCWGTNSGLMHKFNKCRNLACKLAVPGCVTDPISGNCVGSVVALSNDLDEATAAWIGYPCLQTIPGGLPTDAAGKPDVYGAYAAKLWSVCNCKADSHMAKFDKGGCKGPLCMLFKRPELPSINFAMPNISLADIGPLIDINDWDFKDIGVLFTPPAFSMPRVTVQIPDLSAHVEEVRKYINDTSRLLAPTVIKALKPKIPAFTVEAQGIEVPTLSLNLPASNVEAGDFMPTIDLSELPTDKNGMPTFNVSHLGLPSVQKVMQVFDVHTHLANMGVPNNAKSINEAIDYVHGQLSDEHMHKKP
ncbi:MAG: hypothetical protein J3K34DRAFT_445591 [Monoraphidium minutum]|nr:MAG: hypothetical protein J3K34DRAFT_445591 [Monoraphidium minutum]